MGEFFVIFTILRKKVAKIVGLLSKVKHRLKTLLTSDASKNMLDFLFSIRKLSPQKYETVCPATPRNF